MIIKAKVVLYGPERGGIDYRVDSGVWPSFNYDNQLVACRLESDEHRILPAKEEFLATIDLPYGEELNWSLKPGDSFKLNVASQIIGEGTVI